MPLHKERKNYTKSEWWPVVPYRLTRVKKEDRYINVDEENEVTHKIANIKIAYDIGLDETIVKGWALGVSEETHHSTMVVERPLMGNDFTNIHFETRYFYDYLSPICKKIRDDIENMNDICKNQDACVAESIFNKLGISPDIEINNELIEINFQCHDSEKGGKCKICIETMAIVPEDENRYHLKYQCPYTLMTELAFPVISRGVLIALVITGQIIENKQHEIKVREAVDKLYTNNGITKKTITDIDWGKATEGIKNDECNLTRIKEIVRHHINELVKLYEGTVKYEQSEARNQLHSLYTCPKTTYNENPAISESIVGDLENILLKFKEMAGLDKFILYWDCETLQSNFDDKHKRYKQFIAECLSENGMFKWFPDITNDLLEFIKETAVNIKNPKNIPTEEDRENWAFFIHFPNSFIKTYVGDDLTPVFLGVRYIDKIKYNKTLTSHDASSLSWEQLVLPRFAIFLLYTSMANLAKKHATELNDNQEILKHEAGQIVDAVRHLAARNVNYLKTKDRFTRNRKENRMYSELESQYNDLIKRSELFRDDLVGQFSIIEMLTRQSWNKIKVKPELFDVCRDILYKWRIAFSHGGRSKYNYIDWEKAKFPPGYDIRSMHTDSRLLEHVLYNVINNAVKYSADNSRIYIEMDNTADGFHIFKIINYGNIDLKTNNQRIYNKYARGTDENLKIHEDKLLDKMDGLGLGLYLAKILSEMIGGSIKHNSREISKYNIPLMKSFFGEIPSQKYINDRIKSPWELIAKQKDPDYNDIRIEYIKLKNNSLKEVNYDTITYKDFQFMEKMEKPALHDLLHDIQLPTYEVTFEIRVPTKYKGGNR